MEIADRPRVRVAAVAAASLVLVLAACSDEPAGLPTELASIEVLSGADQTGTAGQPLAAPVVARAVSVAGEDFVGYLYVRVAGGDGGIEMPGRRGSGEGVVLASPAFGRVEVAWTLGTAGGPQALEIFAVGYAGDTARATVRATAITAGS